MKKAWAVIAVLLASAPMPAKAASPSAGFDRPVETTRIKTKSDTDPAGAWICTRFADIMVREDGSVTPAPDKAALIPLRPGMRPACGKQPAAGQITLDTEGMVFAGRKGNFLVFTLVDTNGFMPFRVIDARTGTVLFRDSMVIKAGIAGVALEGPDLHLRYRRAVDGSCGLPKDGAGCWATMIRDAAIPPEIASLPPPLQACAASYRASKAPEDDPSIVSYDVALTLDVSGHTKSKASGRLDCMPTP